ncbi:MAG: fibronectin type III domain-containing protein [candidate division Zixibacteria bacterium]|nr:fibronectin type III domain-containing protein [candidate division Zixibacteria bacterium]
MKRTMIALLLMAALTAAIGRAQENPAVDPVPAASPPAPPTNVVAADSPDDPGRSVTVRWQVSADDGAGMNNVIQYKVFRGEAAGGPFVERGVAPSRATVYVDKGTEAPNDPNFFPNNTDLFYKVAAVNVAGETAESEVAGPVQAREQWYNVGRTPTFIAVIVFTAFTLYFIARARKKADLYIRPLAGIEAVDEAIGRATEMGRPMLYVFGLGTASDIATIASVTILSRVAKKVAEYQTELIVPCYDPIVMTIAQETVKTAYYDAGRPDAYKEDSVYFVTQSQFAYVAAVNGTILRELPATNFYLGKFFAESLLLAETGALAGSIQISGTDEVAQIPFFVVACDYTLIGEELYAASAYLGREPKLMGSLKAQDYAKAIIIICAVAGVAASLFGWTWFVELFRVTN